MVAHVYKKRSSAPRSLGGGGGGEEGRLDEEELNVKWGIFGPLFGFGKGSSIPGGERETGLRTTVLGRGEGGKGGRPDEGKLYIKWGLFRFACFLEVRISSDSDFFSYRFSQIRISSASALIWFGFIQIWRSSDSDGFSRFRCLKIYMSQDLDLSRVRFFKSQISRFRLL